MSPTRSISYQFGCVTRPIFGTVVIGVGCCYLDNKFTAKPWSPKQWGIVGGAVYLQSILQCPMEAIQGRQSKLHEGISGAIVGYMGVQTGLFKSLKLIKGPPTTAAAYIGGACLTIEVLLGNKPW